jgi:hypothetical protein
MHTDVETEPEALAFSIKEFCRLHAISERFYFKLKADGRGPDEITLGHRVLISREAAARWRAERETESSRKRARTPGAGLEDDDQVH